MKRLPKYVIVQRCPVPRQLAPILTILLRESGASLQSCYRGDDARQLLHDWGKHSQAELYHGFANHLPGYNPANPPGFSTHELRSDGVAYPQFKRGRRVPWWCQGIDIDDGHVIAFQRAAKRHGWQVFRPYPSGSEFHHVNFRKPPLLKRIKARATARRGS